ncbi:hypothetical protein, partial [Corynebacterium sp.]|uniref:hypothetical protein n=1 Tax=Corynebacterium sp. TaxID=1720 RepID=UPI002A91525A
NHAMLIVKPLTPMNETFSAVHYSDTDDGWKSVTLQKGDHFIEFTEQEAKKLAEVLSAPTE